ncbi:multidrug ABC transporter [Bifidobacterium lemurum]|uniref:Multidrug ABC transporter n=1 Tax=Bifidobacterium lemurum TaxID=1603886 RepID=A0A261FQA3_9BIFI|nr:MFS transporter [Bifidobacterium lemurum]OZG61360.1 multidrug ABC transporter [Bifidobacterium lemurum]QOL34744.1 MFS transporter [Bifidobacterium lemurum]
MNDTVRSSSSVRRNGGGKSVAFLMVAFLTATFAFQLNASMLSPALVTMQEELNTSATQIGLSQTVFFTSSALFSLFLPRLADLVGRKKVLLGMLLATVCGCSVAALAPNVPVLLLGRLLQGTAGPIVTLCMIMLHVRVPDEKQYTKLMAIITSVNGGIAGVDAIAGGWIAGTWGYRPIFWVMAGIGLLSTILVAIVADESKAEESNERMDWPGVLFLVLAVGTALTAVNSMQRITEANWLLIGVLLAVAAVAFVVFWNIEKRSSHPMSPIHYIKQRRTWGLLLTALLTLTGVFAIMNGVVPAIAQDAEAGAGISASVSSFVTLTPYAIIGLVFGPISGVLATKFGYRKVLRCGLVVSVAAAVFGVFVAHSPSAVGLLAMSLAMGVGYAGTANIMLNGLGIVLSPKDNPGYLPGFNAGAFNLGAGISYTILYGIMDAFTESSGATAGYTASMIGGAVILLLALLSSFLIPKPESDVA